MRLDEGVLTVIWEFKRTLWRMPEKMRIEHWIKSGNVNIFGFGLPLSSCAKFAVLTMPENVRTEQFLCYNLLLLFVLVAVTDVVFLKTLINGKKPFGDSWTINYLPPL